ncbi:MAG: hypothetical protein RJA44_2153 [Pseudomonadota bacterium]
MGAFHRQPSRRRSLAAACALMSAWALVACGGGGGDASASAAAQAASAPTPADLQAELSTYQGLAVEAARARANAAQLPAMRAASDWSGLTDALGGAAATDAALAAGAAATRSYLDGTGRTQLDTLLTNLGVPVGAAPNGAVGTRVTTLSAGRARINASGDTTGLIGLTASFFAASLFNGVAARAPYERDGQLNSSSTEAGNSADMMASISRERVRYGHTMTMDDATTGLRLKNITALDSQFCPDANGVMTLKFNSDSRTSKLGDDNSGVNTQVDVTLVAQLDDNATMMGNQALEIRVQQASFQAARGVFVDMTYKLSTEGSNSAVVNRASSAARPEHLQATEPIAIVAMAYALYMAKDMEAAAQGGRCITLGTETAPAGRTNLAPSTAVQIVAKPRSAIDGSMAAGTVQAKLTGGSSITPAQAQADASFAYVAPAAAGQSASVALESRSRRGVGKAALAFSTGAVAARYTGSMTAQTGIAGAALTQMQIDQITWNLDSGSLADALVYRPEGTARVTFSMAGCSVTRNLAIDPASSHLTVYGPDERPDGRQKGYFAQVNTVKVTAALSCALLPQPVAVELQGVFRNGCDGLVADPGLPRYTDIQTLSGTRDVGAPCSLIGTEPHSWTLQAVVP